MLLCFLFWNYSKLAYISPLSIIYKPGHVLCKIVDSIMHTTRYPFNEVIKVCYLIHSGIEYDVIAVDMFPLQRNTNL